MIIEALAVGVLIYNVDKSTKLDEQALKKYAKAFEMNAEAELMLKNKAELVDKRLANVAKKKRAIVENTIPKFVQVYGQIQSIDIEKRNKCNEIAINNKDKLAIYDKISISKTKKFTDKELVCGLLFKGLCGMMIEDSERYLSAAHNQMRSANVAYEQAQSVCAIYDAIIARADRISKLLMNMNAVFVKSIDETARTINKNGLDVRKYNDFDKGVLMTCVNIALAMSDIIDIPVVNPDGKICEQAMKLIVNGEKYLDEIERKISN